MKFATLPGTTADGRLVLVSRDLRFALDAASINVAAIGAASNANRRSLPR